MLRRLAELRAAVVDGIGQAPDLNALRRVLHELFVKIELVRCPIRFKFDTSGWVQDGPTVDNAGATFALVPYFRHECWMRASRSGRAELRLDEELITRFGFVVVARSERASVEKGPPRARRTAGR